MDKKEFHDKMFDLQLKQALYIAEHKEYCPEIKREILDLRKVYGKELANEMMGEVKNVERKRK